MGKKLLGLKDLIWAACILIGLLALLVGFIVAATHKYTGDPYNGRVELGAQETAPVTEQIVSEGGDGTLHELVETPDMGLDYISSLTFLCDSALIGLRDYGVLPGGIETDQVWGSAAGNIPFETLAACKIKYPADGSIISAAEAAMIKKPAILVISLGSDGLANADEESFKSAYKSVISSIRSASPSTQIICCSLTSVSPNYAGVDNLSARLVGEANDWLTDICVDTGVYYANLGNELHSSGYLMSEFAASNGKGLNNSGLNIVLDYLRTHRIP